MQRWWEKHSVLSWELLHRYEEAPLPPWLLKIGIHRESRGNSGWKGHRKSVVQAPLAQSRVRHEVRPRCSGLYSSGYGQPARMDAAFFVNLLHCLAVLTVKKKFFISSLNLLSFSLCLLSLTVPSQPLWKAQLCLFNHTLQVLRTAERRPWSHRCLMLN